jgi:Fe-S-cluster-containing hydrogenase component 2
MQKALMIDPDKCTGCRICETWCSFTHEGITSPTKARIHVIKWEDAGLDIPMTCQQCETPVCAKVCPVSAITRDSESGLVSVDEGSCIGCRMCVVACPFGGCSMDPDTSKMVKCDFCGGEPLCAVMCPREAIKFVPATKIAIKKKRASASKLSELLAKIASP